MKNNGKNASGTYVIDENYEIVMYNNAAKNTYPQLEIGRKCYKCLMDLDEPCAVCPVLNEIEGPKTYFDPIREIYETVDAVELLLQDGRACHALVLSTIGEREVISRQLPTSREELRALLEQEYYDKLTGGFSRNGFIREAEQILNDPADSREHVLLLFNLRNFKAINEIFGIEGGDILLKTFFYHLRNSSLKPRLLARLDSDRMIALVEKENLELERLDELLEFNWQYNERKVRLNIRCGIYFIDESEDVSISSMIDRASIAQQSAGDENIRSYSVFDSELQKDYVGQAELISEFQNSINRGDFKVYYQPIIETATGKVHSAEALVRWEHPQFGFFSPNVFIPLLEKRGYITILDRYIVNHVYEFQKRRQIAGECLIPVSVNLSWQDFYDDRLMNEIFERAKEGTLDAGGMNFEVTETSFTTMEQNCSYLLEQFRNCGAEVILDDFGSGYSSFGMIRNYSFDIIKIDRSFIRQIEDNRKVRNIIASIVEMCHKIDVRVVAEGVETEEELRFLQECGSDYIQGFYYSKPLTEQRYEAYLREAGITNPEQNDGITAADFVDIIGKEKRTAAAAESDEADPGLNVDLMTGLQNRIGLFEILKRSLAGQVPKIQTMFMLDIDGFKQLNEAYGHMIGDECLRGIAGLLEEYGTFHQMKFFRYGGEEFLGLNFDQRQNAEKTAEDLLNLIRNMQLTDKNGRVVRTTVSIGYTEKNSRYEKMVAMADQAMYFAKRRGKNRAFCYEKMSEG